MDSNTLLATRSMSFLENAAAELDNSPGNNILKSYYLTKCRTIGVRNAIKLPNKVNDSSFRCPRCCILQNENDSKFRIEAQKKLTRFAKSILKKQAKGERLTKLQEKFLRKIHQGNRYVITCGLCKHKVTKNLNKPVKQQTAVEENLVIKQSTKKKRKRTDRFSGLNKDIIMSLKTQVNLNQQSGKTDGDKINANFINNSNNSINKSNNMNNSNNCISINNSNNSNSINNINSNRTKNSNNIKINSNNSKINSKNSKTKNSISNNNSNNNKNNSKNSVNITNININNSKSNNSLINKKETSDTPQKMTGFHLSMIKKNAAKKETKLALELEMKNKKKSKEKNCKLKNILNLSNKNSPSKSLKSFLSSL